MKGKRAKEKLSQAIEEYLRQIRDERGLKDYFALYSEGGEEIKSYLEVASKVREVFQQVEIPAGLEERGLNRVLTELQLLKKSYKVNLLTSLKEKVAVWQVRPKVTVVFLAIVIVMMLVMSSLVYASSTSLPGSFLYPIKRLVEDVQLAFTFDEYKKAQLYSELARRRAEEAKELRKVDQEEAQQVAKEGLQAYRKAEKLLEKLGKKKIGFKELVWLMEFSQELVSGKVVESQESKPAESTVEQSEAKQSQPKVALDNLADNTREESVEEQTGLENDKKTPTTSKRVRKVSVDGEENKTSSTSSKTDISPAKVAGFGSFDVKSIRISSVYLSPNNDGVKDSVTISVTLEGEAEPVVVIYRGSQEVIRLTGQKIDGETYRFDWNGKTASNNLAEDGTYTVKVVNKQGQVAKQTGKVILDTKPPKITLIEPPSGVVVSMYGILFTWKSDTDIEEYTLNLVALDYVNLVRKVSGITNSHYEFPGKKLLPGKWGWFVVAVDKAGNSAKSDSRLVVVGR